MTDYDEQVRTVERVTVTKITLVKGRGIEGDPVREVERWYDDYGRYIGYLDPCSVAISIKTKSTVAL